MSARHPAIRWHLRQIMATRGMFATSDLVAPLAEHGVVLSREQVYRLVTGTPERLSTRTLAALCFILEVTVNDLIEVVDEAVPVAKISGETSARRGAAGPDCRACGPPLPGYHGDPAVTSARSVSEHHAPPPRPCG